ncbi:phytoene/squalene synthase family protein [Streptacidiphilus sp. EB129]|uniref:phytoene/squalene synthase family protein n=1 Tax=Streptacidiphilus sp. EB129 TaxID=3156262 RepID=UPI0035114658
MTTWRRTLDSAGIVDPVLREDYSQARTSVARYKRDAYFATRLLLPSALVPHVLVATAFMHHTDNLLDSGPVDSRAEAYQAWEGDVRAGLGGAGSEIPLVRALADSSEVHQPLRAHVEGFLDTAASDLNFPGFDTEEDYQRYIDAYSLPALMVVACLLAPQSDEVDPAEYRAACRTYIDGSQRLDFVNDLAEDLEAERFTVPGDVLKEHRVTRGELEGRKDTPQVRALLAHLLGQARESLVAGRALADLTPAANRPLVRALVELDLLTADGAVAKGAGLLSGSARPSVPAALRLLLREYRLARRYRA